ncbi:MAG TPA: hypothetical protein VJQ57_03885 [Acidimicrobiia bacterium]|nr:hypothetical protein [Acidimicrobiia bacterium]
MKYLLDANIILRTSEFGCWDELRRRATILVPSIVARKEAMFSSRRNKPGYVALQLPELIKRNELIEASASAAELISVAAVFDDAFLGSIDDGEKEALAILMTGRLDDVRFATADRAAINGLAMIGLGDVGISLEEILRETGLARALPHYLTKSFFDECIARGQEKRIRGEGLRRR